MENNKKIILKIVDVIISECELNENSQYVFIDKNNIKTLYKLITNRDCNDVKDAYFKIGHYINAYHNVFDLFNIYFYITIGYKNYFVLYTY
jgi:hypothetical protein